LLQVESKLFIVKDKVDFESLRQLILSFYYAKVECFREGAEAKTGEFTFDQIAKARDLRLLRLLDKYTSTIEIYRAIFKSVKERILIIGLELDILIKKHNISFQPTEQLYVEVLIDGIDTDKLVLAWKKAKIEELRVAEGSVNDNLINAIIVRFIEKTTANILKDGSYDPIELLMFIGSHDNLFVDLIIEAGDGDDIDIDLGLLKRINIGKVITITSDRMPMLIIGKKK
jgi:hypothetical protein